MESGGVVVVGESGSCPQVLNSVPSLHRKLFCSDPTLLLFYCCSYPTLLLFGCFCPTLPSCCSAASALPSRFLDCMNHANSTVSADDMNHGSWVGSSALTAPPCHATAAFLPLLPFAAGWTP